MAKKRNKVRRRRSGGRRGGIAGGAIVAIKAAIAGGVGFVLGGMTGGLAAKMLGKDDEIVRALGAGVAAVGLAIVDPMGMGIPSAAGAGANAGMKLLPASIREKLPFFGDDEIALSPEEFERVVNEAARQQLPSGEDVSDMSPLDGEPEAAFAGTSYDPLG